MRKGMRPIFATAVAALFLCGTATAVTAASDQKKKVTHVSKSNLKPASRRPAPSAAPARYPLSTPY